MLLPLSSIKQHVFYMIQNLLIQKLNKYLYDQFILIIKLYSCTNIMAKFINNFVIKLSSINQFKRKLLINSGSIYNIFTNVIILIQRIVIDYRNCMETQLDGPIQSLELKRILGLNSEYKFSTIVGQSTLVYMNGKHLIMQNLKSRKQEIIWSNRQSLQIQLINYLSDNAGCLTLIIICKRKQKRIVIIFESNPQKSKNLLKKRVFELQQIPSFGLIDIVKLLDNGKFFALSFSQSNNNAFLYFCDAYTGKLIHFHSLQFFVLGINQIQYKESQYFCLDSPKSIWLMDSETNQLKKLFDFQLQSSQQITNSALTFNENRQYIGFFLTNIGWLNNVKIKNNHVQLCYRIRINEQISPISSMILSQNKVLIAFPNSCFLSIITFSSIDHMKYKLIYKQLKQKNEGIKGVLSANFSDDGSYTSLIVKKNNGNSQIICLDTVSFIVSTEKQENYDQSFTKCGFLGQVRCVSICSLNEKLFVLNNNQIMYVYHLVDNIREPNNALLWFKQFKQQPLKIQAHPSAFTLLVLFDNELCVFPYNNFQLFPCLISIKMAKYFSACFSPMGDQILLGGMGQLHYLNYYSLQVIKKVNFPPPKKIIDITFFNRWDVLLNMNNQYLTILQQSGEIFTLYFSQLKGSLVYYDAMHDLVIIADQKQLLVKKRNGLQIAKTDLELTGIKMCLEFETLFLGSKNGHLFLLQWAQDHLSLESYEKIVLCNSAIRFIEISIDFKHLYIASDEGTIFIFQLIQNEAVKIKKHISMTLLQKTQRINYLAGKTLRSLQKEQETNQFQSKLSAVITQMNSTHQIDKQQYRKIQQRGYARTTMIAQNSMKSQLRAFQIENGGKAIYKLPFLKQRLQEEKQNFHKKLRQETNDQFTQQAKLAQLYSSLKKEFNMTILDHDDELLEVKAQYATQLQNQQQYFRKQLQSGSKLQQGCLNQLQHTRYKNNLDMMDVYQNYISNKNTLTQELSSTCKQLWQQNQNILCQNRQLITKIHHLKMKNKQIFIQENDLAKQLKYVTRDKQQGTKQRQQLVEQLIETHKNSDKIILQNKQREAQLKATIALSNIKSMQFQEKKQHYQIIEKELESLQSKFNELQELLVKQLQQSKNNVEKLQQNQEKLLFLKNKRKKLEEHRVIIKIKLQKNIQRYPETQILFNQQKQDIQPIKKRDINSSEVVRWNGLKQTFTNQYKVFLRKIKEENKRLTYKYNVLKQSNHQLSVSLNHLKSELERHRNDDKKYDTIKLSLHKARRESPGNSFFQTQPEFEVRINKPKKIGAKFCSLYEGNDKFTINYSNHL